MHRAGHIAYQGSRNQTCMLLISERSESSSFRLRHSGWKQSHFDLRDVFFQEVHANGLLVISGKNALTVTLNHARFTNSTIAYNHHLKNIKKNKSFFDTIPKASSTSSLFFSHNEILLMHIVDFPTLLLHHCTDLWEKKITSKVSLGRFQTLWKCH